MELPTFQVALVTAKLHDNPVEGHRLFYYGCKLYRSTLEKIPDSSEESETHSLTSSYSEWKSLGNFLRVDLPSSQSTVVPLVQDMKISDVVASICKKRQLEPEAYFMKLGLEDNSGNIGRDPV